MDFIDQLKQFSKRVETLKDTLQTEEATKTALIMLFFAMLGYDVFNPQEFTPEFTADVGIKKGEKVDYAVIIDDKPAILVECKSITEPLERHDSQLFRYFATTNAKFAILTNGQYYRFYTDLDSPNKMDTDPFLSVDILDVRENQVAEIKKFCKSQFDVDAIFSTASELKYVHEFKQHFSAQLSTPEDDFVKFFLQACYSGQKTKTTIEKFRPIVQKALNDYISETMNDKIKVALGGSGGSISGISQKSEAPTAAEQPDTLEEPRAPKIITTEEELEAYFIIKNMLSDITDIQNITYKDTESYINILYKANSRKWICRLKLTEASKVLIIPDENKKEMKFQLLDIYELRNYKEQLNAVLLRYL